MSWLKGRINRRPDPANWNFLGDPPKGFVFLTDDNGQIYVQACMIVNPSNTDPISPGLTSFPTQGDAFTLVGNTGNYPGIFSANYAFNENNWDRVRNNSAVSVFASSARTATTNSADQTNYGARGARLFLDISAVSGTAPTLDVKLQGKDSVSGNYVDIPSAAFAQKTAVGTDDLVVYPGAVASANRSLSQIISRTWRAVATIAGTTPSFTFSLSVAYVL